MPLLGGLLPSDTYSIYKRGRELRLDTTLLGMSGLRWERGSISLILKEDGRLFVLDNELRAAADARLAFTRPKDSQVQDWVRKLLCNQQKITDYWSRDVVCVPVLQRGLLGGLMQSVRSLASGAAGRPPRGRISEVVGHVSTSATSLAGVDLAPLSPPTSPPVSPVALPPDDPRQLKEDVGVWPGCSVFEMQNLCVRDTKHPPLLRELKLADWWKPEYSRQADDANAATRAAEAAAAEAAAAAKARGDVVGAGEAPERLLLPLHRLLRAIRLGKVNERNAASATMDQFEGLAFGDLDEGSTEGRDAAGRINTAVLTSFESQFGCARPADSLDSFLAAPSSDSAGVSSEGIVNKDGKEEEPEASPPLAVPGGVTAKDGRLHAAATRMCHHRASALEVVEKIMDLRVSFSKDFPLTPEQFLPVAEMMSRTSDHAQNFKAFFETKMPKGAGFPVKFEISVFPTVTATVTFAYMNTTTPVPRSMFEVPRDFKMGAYVERGFLRQL